MKAAESQIVFVVDDNAAVRKSLAALFAAAGLPVETFASSEEFLAVYEPTRPACLVLDLRLRGESGLDLLDTLGKTTLPVIVLTAHGSVPASVRAMKAGAVDFLEKPGPPALLLARVREALASARDRRHADDRRAEVARRVARLTPREWQVATFVAAGKKSRDIAAALGVSTRTVEGYRSRVLGKMQAGSATELVATLLRAGVVLPR